MLGRLLTRVRGGEDIRAELARLREAVKARDQELEIVRARIEKQSQLLKNTKRRRDYLNAKLQDSGLLEESGEANQVGSLPDFLIMGARKGGTGFLYRLLSQHPYVEPAKRREVHYFDVRFAEGIDRYRSNFSAETHRDRRRMVTGEKSSYYLYHPHAPRRAAETVPGARLIAFLRNPVNRAYSNYHHQRRIGHEHLPTFEEAIAAEPDRLRGEREKMLTDAGYVSANHRRLSYLSRGLYAEQLREWRRFFAEDQILILRSEDLYWSTESTLNTVLAFLGLVDWQPDRNILEPSEKQRYPVMDLQTRRRLEPYFEPYNRELYEYLGRDLGW